MTPSAVFVLRFGKDRSPEKPRIGPDRAILSNIHTSCLWQDAPAGQPLGNQDFSFL
jgi:hypothetical protein